MKNSKKIFKVQVFLILVTLCATQTISPKSSFAGLDKVKNAMKRAIQPTIKIDQDSFKQYIENAKIEESNKPSSKLANIINASEGSTIKGLSEYTSKKESEAADQIVYSKSLTDNFLNWANQFELGNKLKTNEPSRFIDLKNKINECYENQKNTFIKFAQDVGIESSNIEDQISILSSLYNSFEVRSNNKISSDIQKILEKLAQLQENLESLIDGAENLIDISLSTITKELDITNSEETFNVNVEISENYFFRTKTR